MDKSFRYKQLDQLLRFDDGYTLNELVINLDDDISPRTLLRDIDKIQKPPYNMKLAYNLYRGKSRLYRYENINDSIYDISEDVKSKFDNVIASLDSFAGIPQYDWMKFFFVELSNGVIDEDNTIISFDGNQELLGVEFLTPLAKAIAHKQPLRLNYKPFSGEEIEVKIHPYHLRQYNNRWFLFAKIDGTDYIASYPLDRIQSVNDLSKPYIPSTIDFEEYFDDIIGVSIPKGEVRNIVLRINKKRYGYIKTKKLHWTQDEIKERETEDSVFISIQVKVNNELFSTLLSFGQDLEVISPINVRDRMTEVVKSMYNSYMGNQHE